MNEQDKTDPQRTRSSLMRRLTDPKDVEAWNEFVRTYARLIKFGAGRLGIREPDSDAIVQDVLLAVRKRLIDEGYNRTWETRKWLRIVTRNKSIDWLRAEGRHRSHLADPSATGSVGHPAGEDDWITEELWDRHVYSAVLERVLERVAGEFDREQLRAFEITSVARETGTDGTTLLTVQTGESIEGSIDRAAAETGWKPARVSREIYKVRKRVEELFQELSDV